MPSTPRFELFAFWRTSATYRVRVALNLKGLAAQERIINLDAAENRSADFLAVNPMGAVPALVDHGAGQPTTPISQSQAILEFLEEAHPETPLLPKGLHDRARVRSLAAMLVADTHPLLTGRIKKYLVGNGHMDDAGFKAWQTHWFTTGLQAFEKRLASDAATGTYCHGNHITMADICLASIIVVMRIFKIEVADIPHIMRIMATLDANEAFAKAAPMKQVGAPTA
jgi:maleylacetoacetate isomerase